MVRVEKKSLCVLPTCMRKCVNLNNSFVRHCAQIQRVIEFYYAGLAKISKYNLGKVRFVLIIVVIRIRCESRTLNGSYEDVSGAEA